MTIIAALDTTLLIYNTDKYEQLAMLQDFDHFSRTLYLLLATLLVVLWLSQLFSNSAPNSKPNSIQL